MNVYPTRDQIMDSPPKHKPEVLRIVKSWKNDEWYMGRRRADRRKFEALALLIDRIAMFYGKPVEISFDGNPPYFGRTSGASFYNDDRIFLAGPPSILTALHELAHHLFGPDELKACRWSVHLFKKIFPKAFARLRWEGHTLVR